MSGISRDYAALYDYYPAQGVVHCENCPKIFKFHPQKTGYTTIKEHYATTHPEEFRQFNLKRNQAESVPSVAKFFKSDKKCEKMSKNQKLALSFTGTTFSRCCVQGNFHSLQCFTILHHTAYIRRKKLLCCKRV